MHNDTHVNIKKNINANISSQKAISSTKKEKKEKKEAKKIIFGINEIIIILINSRLS